MLTSRSPKLATRHSAAVIDANPRRRRVVVLASLATSLLNFRGQLLREMIQVGHDVIAVASENDPVVASKLSKFGVDYQSVPMARASISPLVDLCTFIGFVRIIRRLQPDVLLAYTAKPIIYGGIVARLLSVPYRYAMITGLGYVYAVDEGGLRRRLLKMITNSLYKQALHGISVLFVYNKEDELEFTRNGMLSGRQRVIRVPGSGVDLAHFSQVPLPPGPPVFLLVSRLLRDKGLLEYIQAARGLKSRYPELRIQLLGPFDPNPTCISQAQLDSWVREGVIEYLGETGDVRPYIAACTVFVLPSYYREGIPRSILEAMAIGRAVITTDAPGCRDTVVNEENGLIVPVRNSDALAQAMERFVREPELAVRMGKRSRELATAQFDVHTVNRILLSSMDLI